MKNPIKHILDSIFSRNVEPVSNTPGLTPEMIKGYNKTRDGSNHIGICHAPSVNMYFSQDGSVKACCHNMEFSIGKYPEQSLKEIWQSEKAKEFREYMRTNNLAGGCSICLADLKIGSFNEVRARHFDQLPVNPDYPTMMEFLLTNTCNLECVMCIGEFSSLIRKNREKLPPIHNPYDKAFLEQIKEFIPHLKETRFSGSGEAFSIDMNYEIWDMLIAQNPGCLIVVQTNGTILTGRGKEIMAKGKFQIGVSLDSLKKEVFETIRVNANFDKVMDNIQYFNKYCKERGTRFSIAMCVMRQNWQELPDFIHLANSLNAVGTFHKVWMPEQHALHNLPTEELDHIYQYLSSVTLPSETPLQRTNAEHYRYFVEVIKNWRDNPNELVALTSEELLPYLKNKFTQHLELANEQDIDTKVTMCLQKVNEVSDMLAPSEQEYLLRRLCLSPAKHVYESFASLPADQLFEGVQKDMRRNAANLIGNDAN